MGGSTVLYFSNAKILYRSLDVLEDKFYYNSLFDAYGELLTKKQFDIMSMFLVDDLSVTEIAENLSVSRQSVFSVVQKSKEKLKEFENYIGFVSIREGVNSKLESLISNIDTYSRDELIFELGSIRIDR